MEQNKQKIKNFWELSGSLSKKNYFMPMAVLSLLIWSFMFLFSFISFFTDVPSGGFLGVINYYINGTIMHFIILIWIYINFRFYPWVAIMLSQLPFFNRFFKINQSFLDSLLAGYHQSKSNVDRLMPSIKIQEHRINYRTGSINNSRSYSNSPARVMELVGQLLLNYILIPYLKFMFVWLLFAFSFILGLFAIPFVMKKID
ncbi:hypothetical protein [Carnobacterium sp. TMP28]|uniref:hypothetical protein n=1 Tax=Carnobacterium sp. TMP28 TaxID=3397060 RepID=UPI0039E021B2